MDAFYSSPTRGRGGQLWTAVAAGAGLGLAGAIGAQGTGPSPSIAVQPVGSGIVVTGLPSLVEHPRRLWSDLFGESAPICVDFAVRSVGVATPQLRLLSAGIAGARLLDLTAARSPACGLSGGRGTTSISVLNIVDDERPIRLVLPPSSFPMAPGGAKGKVLLLRPNAPVIEAPIALQSQDYPPFQKAFIWFFGVAVPATITAILGLLIYRLQKWIDSKSAGARILDQFRRDMNTELQSFFGGLYQITMALGEGEFRATMERELGAKGILSALPRDLLNRLLPALRRHDTSKLARVLAAAFPDHRETILKPTRKSGK